MEEELNTTENESKTIEFEERNFETQTPKDQYSTIREFSEKQENRPSKTFKAFISIPTKDMVAQFISLIEKEIQRAERLIETDESEEFVTLMKKVSISLNLVRDNLTEALDLVKK